MEGIKYDVVVEEDWAELNLYLGIIKIKWRWF